MSQLKTGMGCTLDGATPDNKAVGRGRLGARGGEVEGWDRGSGDRDARKYLRGTEVRRKGLGMEIESHGGLLNVDLWALHFPGSMAGYCGREGIPSVLAYGSNRISETELNTPRGHRGTEEITSEFVKRP